MLITGFRLINAPVMGLQTGTELARISRPVIDPKDLHILAYEVEGSSLDLHPSLLRIADVREFSDIGIIIDSSDEFVSPDDIIKLGEVYHQHFELIGLTVRDENKNKLGRVDGYTVETGDFVIQQLSVKRPILKSLNDTHLLIHRSQIIEINDKEIITHSHAEIPEPTLEKIHPTYVNPFRKNAQAEHTDTES